MTDRIERELELDAPAAELWDADTARQIGAPLRGHTAAVFGMADRVRRTAVVIVIGGGKSRFCRGH